MTLHIVNRQKIMIHIMERSFESAFCTAPTLIGARYRHTFNDWASVYGKAEGNVALHTVDFAPSIRDEDPIQGERHGGFWWNCSIGRDGIVSDQREDS